jgi:hypothetical protein
MTDVKLSVSKEYFTHDYVDSKIASYVFYPCEYCGEKFQLVRPDDNFTAGGAYELFDTETQRLMK